MKLCAIVLAAGEGTRMKSKTPKVLHKVSGKPMVEHVIDTLENIKCEKTIIVIGSGKEKVQNELSHINATYIVQEKRLGTGHAVLVCKDEIEDDMNVLITCGDTPLLRAETLEKLVEFHSSNKLDATVMTVDMENPNGYGRILRDENHFIKAIIEQKDANEEEKEIKEINSGVYCFTGKALINCLDKIDNKNSQGEYYLTDAIKIIDRENGKVSGYKIEDHDELLGVNSREQLAQCEIILKNRINKQHLINGVTIIDTFNTYIDKDVVIGRDTIIYPGSIIKGKTVIGEDCTIGPATRIEDSKIQNGVSIKDSTVVNSCIDDNTTIGPYAYIRPESEIGKNVKIGDFVEVKKMKIGDGSKLSHLTYAGDGEIGKNVNIGCGVVFVNYDGKNKNKTIVEDNAFVGCNVNLIAPVTVEEGAYVAAGSTITKNVPKQSLAIAREKQKILEGWVERKNRKK